MIKTSLIVAGILSFSAAFAQTSSNHIEISVSETVELKPTQAEIHLFVQSAQSQRDEQAYYNDYSESSSGYEWFEPTEEDYEYEQLMYENPKKVTKKMTQEYEARQKQREEDIAAMELERLERQRQNELELADFEAFEVSDLMALLTENNIRYTIVNKNTLSEDAETEEVYDWSDYDYTKTYSDSIFSIIVTDSKSYNELIALLYDLPAFSEIKDIKFESNETINGVTIPKLTEKATSEARALANSFGRKLGKVISCTNVYPYTPSKEYMNTYMGADYSNSTFENRDGDPFQSSKKETLEYIYRFELLN